MKCQYESEILYKLMERDGFNIPSSVPPYEAEIKAYLINQVKQAYPKLTDYEAEWLLYNYTKHLPAEFPIRSVSDVTEATFENVVPFAYQNAILKGQTLVNIKGEETNEFPFDGKVLNDFLLNGVKDNTKYLILYDLTITDTVKIGILKRQGNNLVWESSTDGYITDSKGKLILNTNTDTYALRIISSENNSHVINNLTIIEYQEGMENWDIPYFEGMKSVQMPVLKTTGKNVCDMVDLANKLNKIDNKIAVINESTWEITSSPSYIDFKYRVVKFKENTSYTLSFEGQTTDSNRTNLANIIQINYTDGTSSKMRSIGFNKLTTSSNKTIDYICFTYGVMGIKETISKLSIIEGESTSYEPYKTNILTVNEDVTLRGIGNVQDELDLLTGELTQRVGEVVLDGSDDEAWEVFVGTRGLNYFRIPCVEMIESNNEEEVPNNIVSDRIKFEKYGYLFTSSSISENIVGATTLSSALGCQCIYIYYKNISDIDSFKQYLQQNPITIHYQLATESIKTVDLTTVNEKGETTYFIPLEGTMNVQSSGEIIQPTFDMSVPVEATTQNLASFIELEME